MTRIFADYVYGSGPRAGCWWDETIDLPSVPAPDRDLTCDVAIIGGGFTGLNAARELARRGRDVVVLDAEHPGWGASGRNGGFCTLGGSKRTNAQLDRTVGEAARREWRVTEKAAVAFVTDFVERSGADVDAHSSGETWLAHRRKDMDGVDDEARAFEDDYGTAPEVHSAADLQKLGMSAGFHGGMTLPFGFALNPRKYVAALMKAATWQGARLFGRARVDALEPAAGGWRLTVGPNSLNARQVLVATNGYSSEHLPSWLGGRYLPVQSSIGVTRVLSEDEMASQGWTSHQMCFDSRKLLHYFRLMPNGRMLFGLRGGLGDTPASEARARARLRRDFDAMFPAWAGVDFTHVWSGMVCLAWRLVPYAGPVPGADGLFCALCYHGSGVSMGSYSGHMVASVMSGDRADPRPALMRQPLGKFPLGRARRLLLPPAYTAMRLQDL